MVVAYGNPGDSEVLRAAQVFGEDFYTHVDIIKKISPYAASNYLIKGGGYNRYLFRMSRGNKLYEKELFDRLDQVRTLFCGMQRTEDFLSTYDLPTDGGEHPESRVGLYTFHGSKGLEFDHVFIIAANEGKCEDIEEERRMFYVAVTRARQGLTVISTGKRNGKKQFPSRFIGEMQDTTKDLAK